MNSFSIWQDLKIDQSRPIYLKQNVVSQKSRNNNLLPLLELCGFWHYTYQEKVSNWVLKNRRCSILQNLKRQNQLQDDPDDDDSPRGWRFTPGCFNSRGWTSNELFFVSALSLLWLGIIWLAHYCKNDFKCGSFSKYCFNFSCYKLSESATY